VTFGGGATAAERERERERIEFLRASGIFSSLQKAEDKLEQVAHQMYSVTAVQAQVCPSQRLSER
jgi:hypothetical protein